GGRPVRRQGEAVRLLDVDLDALTGLEPVGEEGGGDAQTRAAIHGVTYGVHGQVHLARRVERRGGDGVEARLQRLEALQERLGIGVDGRKLLERAKHVERCSIAV